MVKKKKSTKKSTTKKKTAKKTTKKATKKKNVKKKVTGKTLTTSGHVKKVYDTMKIASSKDIAYDFGLKVYEKYDNLIKSVIHFGSSAKGEEKVASDIDIIIIIDDISVVWDEELIAWYREELRTLVEQNPYSRPLHLNTVKLSTWWADMMKGDPVVVNVIRYGEAVIDYGGFFKPLKVLLMQGKITSTPEAIYTLLERAPHHLTRARQSLLAAIDGIYWGMVDSAHALLISANITPPSPELIPEILLEAFVRPGKLEKHYVYYYDELHAIAKDIAHGKTTVIIGKEIDELFEKADKFLREMNKQVQRVLEERTEKEQRIPDIPKNE